MRRLVIGDIHGCGKALRTVLETVDPSPNDELIFLGDYIDRGPESRDVIDQILELRSKCRLVTLRGNHEIMLLGVVLGGLDPRGWLQSGGNATITSYGGTLSKIPDHHLDFFRQLRAYYETNDSIFVHAGYCPDTSLIEQDDSSRYWNHLPIPPPRPHLSGKRVYVGHTPQPTGNVLDLGHLVCLDTYCFGGGYLTAMDTESCEVIQADKHGHLRRAGQVVLWQWIKRIGKRALVKLGRVDGHCDGSLSGTGEKQPVAVHEN